MKYFFCVFFSLCFLGAFAQKDERFRFASVHKIQERSSYSIFYPIGTSEFDGIVILIHSDQASNPKSYGKLINQLLLENYIVIYPAYQSFVASSNKRDLQYISSSLKAAYKDIKENYESVNSLPVAFLGHSMGGIIAFELAFGIDYAPRKPACIISLAPAEVVYHKIENLNFDRMDKYDVYLIIEEEKDKFYRRKNGERIMENLSIASRKKYILHKAKEGEKSRHLNAWSHDNNFSSVNNTLVSYFSRFYGKTNAVDKDVYWPEIKKALRCAFSRKDCEGFREDK